LNKTSEDTFQREEYPEEKYKEIKNYLVKTNANECQVESTG